MAGLATNGEALAESNIAIGGCRSFAFSLANVNLIPVNTSTVLQALILVIGTGADLQLSNFSNRRRIVISEGAIDDNTATLSDYRLY